MKLTEKQLEALQLLAVPGTYLLHRSGSKVSTNGQARANTLVGTRLITLVDDQEVSKLKGSLASWGLLVEGGYLTLVEERPRHGKIYQINDLGQALLAKNLARLASDPPPPPKVFKADVEALAAAHGCTIQRRTRRRWFELSRRDGRELKSPVIGYKPDGSGARVQTLGDLTLTEWGQAIAQAAELK